MVVTDARHRAATGNPCGTACPVPAASGIRDNPPTAQPGWEIQGLLTQPTPASSSRHLPPWRHPTACPGSHSPVLDACLSVRHRWFQFTHTGIRSPPSFSPRLARAGGNRDCYIHSVISCCICWPEHVCTKHDLFQSRAASLAWRTNLPNPITTS